MVKAAYAADIRGVSSKLVSQTQASRRNAATDEEREKERPIRVAEGSRLITISAEMCAMLGFREQ